MNNSFFNPTPPADEPVIRTNVNCMVDIETFDTKPTAAVLAIGAVLFDPRGHDTLESMLERSILVRVAVADAMKHGTVDGGTIAWWFSQEDEAIKQLVAGEEVSLKQALLRFRQFCIVRGIPKVSKEFFPGHIDLPQACKIWAKSPDFDCKILEHAGKRVDEWMPLGYHEWRCVRTVQDLAWPDPDDAPNFEGVAHDARIDAANQALLVQAAYRQLGLGIPEVKYDTY